MEKNESKKRELRFNKEMFIKANFYNKDILNAVLKADEFYTEKEAMAKIEQYLKGRVM